MDRSFEPDPTPTPTPTPTPSPGVENDGGTNVLREHGGMYPHIVQQLREAATAGKSATQLLALWKSSIEAVGEDGTNRMEMAGYFDRAFRWRVWESRALRVWWSFGDDWTPWTDEKIDESIAPLLEEWRAKPGARLEDDDV